MIGRAAPAFALTLICVVAPPQAPARAEEPRQDLRRGMILAAPKILRYVRDKEYRNVGVLKSSSYATLRSGFYVVYAGPFASLKDTLAALGQARSQGFVTSYSRRLGK